MRPENTAVFAIALGFVSKVEALVSTILTAVISEISIMLFSRSTGYKKIIR
jgi:xanthine/uracil permease